MTGSPPPPLKLGADAKMKGSAVVLVVVLVLTVASEAVGRSYPLLQAFNGRNSFFYNAADSSPQSYYPAKVPFNNAKSYGLPREPYQRSIPCEPRTFSYEDCTLCFCTDRRNVALCWDYEGQKCAQTRRLADEQKNLRNNDPHGVW